MRGLLIPVFSAIALAQTTHTIGGSRADTASAIATDPQGNVYLAGSTNSPDFPRSFQGPAPTPGAALLVSADGGKSYIRGSLPHAVLALAASDSALMAGTVAGFFRSTDGGYTWRAAGSLGTAVNALIVDARNGLRILAGTDKGIFHSEDSGESWVGSNAGLPAGPASKGLASSAIRPDDIFAVVNQGVYRSRDGGRSWSALRLPVSPIGPSPTSVTVDQSNPDNVYIAGAYNNTAKQAFLLKSTDGGGSFRQISALAILTSTKAIAVDPSDSRFLFAGGTDGAVYGSSDGGLSWTATALGKATLDAVTFDPYHPSRLYALTDQALYVSTDRGATWAAAGGDGVRRDMRTLLFQPSLIVLGGDPGEHVFVAKWVRGQLLWSFVLGGSYSDTVNAISVDAAGDIYLAGVTSSTDFPSTPGGFQTALKGFQNVFLCKINADGNRLVYSTLLGGSGADGVSALAVDAAGQAYLAGYAESADFPTTRDAYQRAHLATCPGGAAGDAFVSKFAPDGGALVYSTLLGGGCAQTAAALAIDTAGNAYVAGATVSPDFPVTQGAPQPKYGGGYDGFLTEIGPRGDGLVFSTFLGGADAAVAAGVAVDAAGNIYVAGNGDAFPFAPGRGTAALQCGGGTAAYGGLSLAVASPPYLLKLGPDGASVESLTTFAGCGTVAQGLALDAAGSLWVGGATTTPDYDTVAPFQALAAGNGFLRRFAADGKATLFSTLLDGFQALALDSGGAAYVAAGSGYVQVPVGIGGGGMSVDSVGKLGALSIRALAEYAGPIGITGGEAVAIAGHGFGERVSVTFDGIAAAVLASREDRIVCMTPFAVAGKKRTAVQVSKGLAVSNPVVVTALPAAAEVLAVVNADGTVNSAANPAAAGSSMTLYVSGLGVPSGGVPVDGGIGAAMNQTFAGPVSVTFYQDAAVSYLGPAPGEVNGITQINFTAPVLSGETVLSFVGGDTTDFVFVYLR